MYKVRAVGTDNVSNGFQWGQILFDWLLPSSMDANDTTTLYRLFKRL